MAAETQVRKCPEFVAFPKIARWSREVVITEKIDGTNASVIVSDDGAELWAASRSQVISPERDNFGWARWVQEHREELLKLGPGQHFGEWWGAGIQRQYGLAEKRFSLFNVHRWGDAATRPACCGVVPVLWRGPADDLGVVIPNTLDTLRATGSVVAPGFMKPEGIVIFHVAGGHLFKKTLDKDAQPKSAP